MVEWCPLKTDVTVAPPHDGVFIHPQILALGMKLPLTTFVHNVLSYFRVAPSQLTMGVWRILLGFEALCNRFLLEACGREEFYTVYMMRKGPQDARSFSPQKGCNRLIVNQPDNDYGWRDSVIRLVRPWEAAAEEDRRRSQHAGTGTRSGMRTRRFLVWSGRELRSSSIWTTTTGIGAGC